MDELPRTRAEAKAVGAKFYFTGAPCARGHIAKRETKGNCTACRTEDAKNAADTRREYFQEYARRADVKERQHEWYMANRELTMSRAKTVTRDKKREYQQTWKSRNTDKVRADTKARRRKHRQATPGWLTVDQKRSIREIYRVAIVTTKITGERYVVDHIIPLRSDTVCGLHVPWNLRVTTHAANLVKSNTLPASEEYLAFPDGSGYKTRS